MFLYTVLTALVGVVAGILLATRTKKVEGVIYGKLDKAGRITNIVMIPVYLFLSPFCMFIGMICIISRSSSMDISIESEYLADGILLSFLIEPELS